MAAVQEVQSIHYFNNKLGAPWPHSTYLQQAHQKNVAVLYSTLTKARIIFHQYPARQLLSHQWITTHMRKSTCVHKQERTNALAQAMVTQTHLLKQWLHKHQRKYALNQWLPTPGQLPEIRALMLERLRRHREALVLYVHILHSLGAAEAYCDRCSATHTHTHAYTHTHTHTHTNVWVGSP